MKKSESTKDKIIYEENSYYAIQNLGYGFKDTKSINDGKIEEILLPGDEYYYIIPRYQDMSIKIYETSIESDKELVYSSYKAEPFIIKGNISDIYPNILVELISNEGKVIKIIPSISLKDGNLVVGEEATVIESK